MKIHMVKQGDSLYSIAKKYDVSLENIVKANPEISNPDAIEVGMKVKIPSQPKTALEVIHHHIVQQGDTLWKLSKAWGIQLTDMIKANPQLKNPNALLTGEVVNIPKPEGGNESTTATMHGTSLQGKANTGVMPASVGKASTAVQPVPAPPPVVVTPIAEQPAPQPTPLPAPVPTPAPTPVKPIAESKPIYGIAIHEHVELFKQYPVPSVQATVQQPMTYSQTMPQGYGNEYGMQQPVSMENAYPGYGYGMQQSVSMENAYPGYGYGAQQPVGMMENAQAGHGYGGGYEYGMPQSMVQQEAMHAGYGFGFGNQPGIAPLEGHIGGLYGYQDYSYSPPEGPSSVPGMQGQFMAGGGKPASGCKTCGGPSSWPSSSGANAAAYSESYPGTGYADGRVPYGVTPNGMVSPFATGPYGYGSQMVSPANAFPGMQVSQANSYAGSQVSPANAFPGANVNPYYVSPMGDIPVGGGSMNPYYGPQYYGGIPPIPTMPGFPAMPAMSPLDSCRDDEEEDEKRADIGGDGLLTVKAAPAKKRQARPKAKPAAARVNRPKRKESLPWIKW